MPRSTANVEVFCSPAEFKKVLVDFERYPEFLDEVTSVDVQEQTDDSATVTFHIKLNVGGMNIENHYTCNYTIGDDEISWELDSSPVLDKNNGRWKFEEGEDSDETIAHYEGEIITSLPIPEEVQKMFADEQLPELMETFRDRAEDLYG